MRLKKGFTIVEVSLVVAIGGLILVGALIAVPHLLRLTRDSQRKTDMETLVSAIKKYQTNNNRGALPATKADWDSFKSDFLPGDFSDPSGRKYAINMYTCDGVTDPGTVCDVYSGGKLKNKFSNAYLTRFKDFPNNYIMPVIVGAKCGDDNKPVKSSSDRKFAVIYVLEVNDLFCIDG